MGQIPKGCSEPCTLGTWSLKFPDWVKLPPLKIECLPDRIMGAVGSVAEKTQLQQSPLLRKNKMVTLHFRHRPPSSGLLGAPVTRFLATSRFGEAQPTRPKRLTSVGCRFMGWHQPSTWKVVPSGVPWALFSTLSCSVSILSDFRMRATDRFWDDAKPKMIKSGQKQET